jgi:hypothetical protein
MLGLTKSKPKIRFRKKTYTVANYSFTHDFRDRCKPIYFIKKSKPAHHSLDKLTYLIPLYNSFASDKSKRLIGLKSDTFFFILVFFMFSLKGRQQITKASWALSYKIIW